MMKWVKRSIIVGLALCFTVKVLESKGFCVRKFAFLPSLYTEQQLIDKAILYEITHMSGGVITLGGEEKKIKQYFNMEEFKKLNPDCCKLTDTAYEGESNIGSYGYVELSYLQYYLQDSPPEKVLQYLEYNSCGEMKRFDIDW